ncbi:MAG: hypothetical protein HY299_03780 [Verrucomicrobia bacterium]|nr:hypothetical protein [Verrucomicrobiota bacterium]
MNPQARQRTLLIAAVALLVLFIGDKLVVTPLIASWKDRGNRIIDLRKKVEHGNLVLGRDSIIQDRWDEMSTNTLPQEASVAESRVLKAFDRWSQESRVSITSIKPQWKHAADDHATLECRVDGFGSLGTVTRFLHAIEKDPMALRIDVLELGARDNEGKQVTLGLSVSGLQLTGRAQP